MGARVRLLVAAMLAALLAALLLIVVPVAVQLVGGGRSAAPGECWPDDRGPDVGLTLIGRCLHEATREGA